MCLFVLLCGSRNCPYPPQGDYWKCQGSGGSQKPNFLMIGISIGMGWGDLCLINALNNIDPFHKWLAIINSFESVKISLTNLVFELLIQNNFYSQTSLVRLI